MPLTKRPIPNPDKAEARTSSWALEITNATRVLLVTGTTAVGKDGVINHPGDPAGQTRWVMDSFSRLLQRAGYSLADVVRVEATVTQEVDAAGIAAVSAVLAEYFQDVPIQPAAGTLRVVTALARPGMLVELEVMAAQ